MRWTDNKLKFSYGVCHAELSEKAAEDLFNAESTAQWFVGAIETRHLGCTAHQDHSDNISTNLLATVRHFSQLSLPTLNFFLNPQTWYRSR